MIICVNHGCNTRIRDYCSNKNAGNRAIQCARCVRIRGPLRRGWRAD